jgi:hypothetical protein
VRPFTRLQNECVFTEGHDELEKRLKRVDELLAAGSPLKETVKEMQLTLALLKQDYTNHISIYNRNYLRSMLELQKLRQINPYGVAPLKTNGWNGGDLKRIREPAPRKKKDEKKPKRSKK